MRLKKIPIIVNEIIKINGPKINKNKLINLYLNLFKFSRLVATDAIPQNQSRGPSL
jgi:hypothetical protein